jgi:ribonuclease-3
MQIENGIIKIIKPSLVYNYSNKLINKDEINNILLNVDIKEEIKNIQIWQTAFIHNSYSFKMKKNKKYTGFINFLDEELNEDDKKDYSDCLQIQNDSNESLEWLGDSIIKAITAAYLIKRYPSQDEGFRTKLRTKLERTNMLAKFAKYYNFEKYLIISKHMEDNYNGRNNLHILEDAFEAFIGAMYLDFGYNNEGKAYELCRKFIVHTFENCVDFTDLILNDDNYKDQLMRFYQKNFNGKFPLYNKISYDDDLKIYHMGVIHPITNNIIGTGKAQSIKKAEQFAAKQGLKYFNVLYVNDLISSDDDSS